MICNTMLIKSLSNGTTNATDPTNTRCFIVYLILYKPDTKIARTYLYMEDITEIWEGRKHPDFVERRDYAWRANRGPSLFC